MSRIISAFVRREPKPLSLIPRIHPVNSLPILNVQARAAAAERKFAIRRMGDQVLLQRCSPIDPAGKEASHILNAMCRTLLESDDWAGLAAPQIGFARRIMVVKFSLPKGDAASSPREEVPFALFNTSLLPEGDEIVEDVEGCLSIPGLVGLVPRFKRIKLRAQCELGAWHSITLQDDNARVVQHEHDHLEGVLYPSRMKDLTSLSFVDEYIQRLALERATKKAEEASSGPETQVKFQVPQVLNAEASGAANRKLRPREKEKGKGKDRV